MIWRNCGGLLLLALGAIAMTVEISNGNLPVLNKAESELDNKDPEFFFISKLTGLWQVVKDETGKLKAERRTDKSGDKAIAMDYHFEKNLLFWSTYEGKIYSCPMRGRFVRSDSVKMIYKDNWYPVSIAVDYVNDLLYIIDSKTNTLYMMTLDASTGTNLIRSFDPVVAEAYGPRYMEIDPFEGQIFLMDYNNEMNHMYRMNMDGSNPQPINIKSIDNYYRSGSFTLDRKSKRILVSSPYDKAIISLNYEGKEESQKFTRVENYASTMTIDRNNTYLYFVNVTSYSKHTAEGKVMDIMKTDLYRCRYSSTTQLCEEGSLELTKLSENDEWMAMVQLKAVGSPTMREVNNLCAKSPCQDMCIFNAKLDRHTCKCRTGYRLTSEGKCDAIDEFIVFENDNYVGGIDISSEPRLDKTIDEVFKPFKIEMRSLGEDRFGFDYDPLQRRLLYSNMRRVVVKYLDIDGEFSALLNPSKNYGLLSTDYPSNQTYFVEIGNDPPTYSIGVVNIYKNLLLHSIEQNTTNRFPMKILQRDVGQVRSLALDSPSGYVFYLSFDADYKKFVLTRMMLDGSEVTRLYRELGGMTYMTVDHRESKLYYINEKHWVCRADLDGMNSEQIIRLPKEETSPLGCINGLSVFGDWIYIKDRNNIRRANKALSCPKWERFDPKPFNYDMRTQLKLHSTKTNATANSPCIDKGCQQFCFALPDEENKLQAHCDCIDGYKLQPDGRYCEPKQ